MERNARQEPGVHVEPRLFLQLRLVRDLARSRPARVLELVRHERERLAHALTEQDVVRDEKVVKRRTMPGRRSRFDDRQQRVCEEAGHPRQDEEGDDGERKYRDCGAKRINGPSDSSPAIRERAVAHLLIARNGVGLTSRIDDVADKGASESVFVGARLAAVEARRVLRSFPPRRETLFVYIARLCAESAIESASERSIALGFEGRREKTDTATTSTRREQSPEGVVLRVEAYPTNLVARGVPR